MILHVVSILVLNFIDWIGKSWHDPFIFCLIILKINNLIQEKAFCKILATFLTQVIFGSKKVPNILRRTKVTASKICVGMSLECIIKQTTKSKLPKNV